MEVKAGNLNVLDLCEGFWRLCQLRVPLRINTQKHLITDLRPLGAWKFLQLSSPSTEPLRQPALPHLVRVPLTLSAMWLSISLTQWLKEIRPLASQHHTSGPGK